MELECAALATTEQLVVCFVDTLGPTYLGLTGWPPRLLVNAAWWRTASPSTRYGALSVLAGQREGVTPQECGIYGVQPRDLPPERTARAVMAAQSPAWWQALLGYQLPAVVLGLGALRLLLEYGLVL